MRVRMMVVIAMIISLVIGWSVCALAQDPQNTPTPKPKTTKAKLPEGTKIDLNNATLEELMMLPKVGEKMAKAIIEGRPYDKIEDIMKVKGIAEKSFAKMKDALEVKPMKKQGKEEPKTAEPTPTAAPKK